MKKFLTDSKKIVAFILIVFILSACSKWLDVAPEKNLIKDDFWKKAEDANSALAATYSSFRASALPSFIWGEIRADMISGFPGSYRVIAGSDINPINDVVNWSTYYTTINLANTLMYYDKNILAIDKSFTPKMLNGINAEALFLRSFTYFNLIRVWKNVPLVINPSISDTTNIYPPVSDESAIIKQIISDLIIAKDKAYTTEFQGDAKYFRGRANKYAIMALLADVYLWNQQFQQCIDYCDSISNSGLYDLEPLGKWFTIYYPGNSDESIFELQCPDDGTDDQLNPLIKGSFYGGTTFSTLISTGSSSSALVANSTINKYSSLFPDLTDIRAENGKLIVWKYMGLTLDINLTRSNKGQRVANFLYYRYADVVLMKAEALNELGRVSEALDNVNKTHVRAVGQPISDITDQNDMRDVILDERAKEFVIEGKRWFDLLRAAKRDHFRNKKYVTDVLLNNADARSKDVVSSKINDTMMYYLPIPYNELQRNKNLVQNPFYTR